MRGQWQLRRQKALPPSLRMDWLSFKCRIYRSFHVDVHVRRHYHLSIRSTIAESEGAAGAARLVDPVGFEPTTARIKSPAFYPTELRVH